MIARRIILLLLPLKAIKTLNSLDKNEEGEVQIKSFTFHIKDEKKLEVGQKHLLHYLGH